MGRQAGGNSSRDAYGERLGREGRCWERAEYQMSVGEAAEFRRFFHEAVLAEVDAWGREAPERVNIGFSPAWKPLRPESDPRDTAKPDSGGPRSARAVAVAASSPIAQEGVRGPSSD